MTRKEAPHWSYPRRSIHDAPEAPMAIDVPFDWTETQGDLAPIIRKVERWLFCGVLVMAGWFAGCLMALYVMKGVW